MAAPDFARDLQAVVAALYPANANWTVAGGTRPMAMANFTAVDATVLSGSVEGIGSQIYINPVTIPVPRPGFTNTVTTWVLVVSAAATDIEKLHGIDTF